MVSCGDFSEFLKKWKNKAFSLGQQSIHNHPNYHFSIEYKHWSMWIISKRPNNWFMTKKRGSFKFQILMKMHKNEELLQKIHKQSPSQSKHMWWLNHLRKLLINGHNQIIGTNGFAYLLSFFKCFISWKTNYILTHNKNKQNIYDSSNKGNLVPGSASEFIFINSLEMLGNVQVAYSVLKPFEYVKTEFVKSISA